MAVEYASPTSMPIAPIFTTGWLGGKISDHNASATLVGMSLPAGNITTMRCCFQLPPEMMRAALSSMAELWRP